MKPDRRTSPKSSYDCVLITRGHLDTDTHAGKTPQEDAARDWTVLWKLGRPKAASKLPEAGREAWLPHSPQKEPTLPTP